MNINQIISNYNQLKYAISEPVKLKILRYFFASKYENFKGNEPLISVYVPTFNRSKILIDRAVTSVLEQSYKNFEFVIVGDICTDNTEQQLKKVNDKRIKFINLVYKKSKVFKNNKEALWMAGNVRAANYASNLCKGEWLARIDDDQIWTKDHLETLLNFSNKNNLEFCSALHEGIVDGKKIHDKGVSCYSDYFKTKNLKKKIKFNDPRIGDIASWFYRSYIKNFKFNENCWRKSYNRVNDIDLVVRLISIGVEFGYIHKLIGFNHPRPGEKHVGFKAVQEHGYFGIK